jgi:HEAT repeat protein
MNTPNKPNFLGSLMRQVRRIANAFREKPEVAIEDYVLEHFMLYNGLVGTSPEDQPQFKDVRADIFEAILKSSSVDMAIALKIAPLWWEEKLVAIVGEAGQYHEELIACLNPPHDPTQDVAPESLPLRHPDWRVRSNAARILAEINAEQAIPEIITALNEAASDDALKASFCHIIYSLARMRNPQARIAIAKQLDNPDDWLKVDAVGALSKWPLEEVGSDIANALLQGHSLNDYAAVAVSKNYRPLDVLNLPGDKSEAGLELVIGLIEAARGPFINDTTFGAMLEECFARVYELAQQKPSPRRLRALLELSSFITENGEDSEIQKKAELAQAEYSDPAFGHKVMAWLQGDHSSRDPEFRHALKLAAHYRLTDAAPFVQKYLTSDSALLNEAIEATATIGGDGASEQLTELIAGLVDLDERTSKPLSKQPVFEEEAAEAKTYWLALKALGNLPTQQSAELLLKATRDFAPDKRQQAYSALVQVAQTPAIFEQNQTAIKETMRNGLADPAPAVRVAALTGVEKLSLIDLVPEAVRLTAAKENSIVRQARRTIAHLAQDGHAALVTESLKSALATERDTFRRQRLSILLDDISQRQA